MATFDPERFKLAMAKAPDALYARLRDRLDKYTWWFASNRMGRQAGSRLRKRSGALARSFNRTVQGKGLSDVRWTIFTTSKYARIHEFGGEVEPKTKKYLTIPLKSVMTQTGRARGSAPSYGYDKTFKAEVDGKWFVFLKTGKRRPKGWYAQRAKDPAHKDPSIQALFLLVKEHKIEPALGFFETWEKEKPGWAKQVALAVDEALDTLGGPGAR